MLYFSAIVALALALFLQLFTIFCIIILVSVFIKLTLLITESPLIFQIRSNTVLLLELKIVDFPFMVLVICFLKFSLNVMDYSSFEVIVT